MRNYFILFIAIISLASCDKTHCYTCVEITDFGGATKPTVHTADHCGWTEDYKQNYVQSNTSHFGNVNRRTTCSMKQ
jgi:hypothetical protein